MQDVHEIFNKWFVENFQHVGIRSDKLSDLRLGAHKVWMETTREAPLFYDNLNFLKNVSDTFELDIRIDNSTKKIQLSMVDLLHSASSNSLWQDIKRFCQLNVAFDDISSCLSTVGGYSYNWVLNTTIF